MGLLRESSRQFSTRWVRVLAVCAISLSVAGCARIAPLASLNQLAPQQQNQQPAGGTQSQPQSQPQAQAQPEATAHVQAVGTAAPTAAANPTPALPAGVRTTTVRRGPISEILLLNGRVAGIDETPLTFTASGTVSNVYVQAGQSVTSGQVLIDTDAKQLQKDLDAAQSKAQDAADALKKGQDLQAQSQRQATDRRDTAVSDAQARVRQAQTALDKVRAGASDSDKQAADAAVLLAQNNVEKANADQAKATAAADPSALRTAQQAVASAQVALESAQADHAKLIGGPDAGAVRDAQRALATANAGLLAAQTDFDKLNKGPDPFDLRSAQRAVDEAQANLDAVNSGNDVKNANDTRTPAQKQAATTQAKLALQDAQDKLAKLKQPPDPTTVELAQAKVDDAKAGVAAARDKLDTLHKPPDQLSLQKAQSAVDLAQTGLDNAKAALAQLQAGPSSDQVQAARAALDAAKIALQSAQTRRDEVNSHPTPAELQDAQDALNTAQQSYEKAQNGSSAADGGGPDLDALQRGVDTANAAVATAQSALEATHLRAPSDAAIAQVLVQSGDAVDSSKPVIVLAQSSDPVVRVNLLDGDKPKQVDVGQKAQVQIDGSDASLDGEVASFAPPASNGDRIALLKMNWGSARPSVGTGARARITVQQHDSALIVPLRAIKSAGAKQYVESLDGSTRKSYTVEVGIISGTDAEIASGLQDGQSILLDSSTDGTTATRSTVQAGATVVPTSSPTAAPTPIVAPTANTFNLASLRVAQRSTLLDEWFADDTRNWPNDPQSTAWIADRSYHLATRQAANFVAVGIPGTQGLGDGTVSASFRKTGGPSGGGYGLILRAQGAGPLDGVSQSGRFYVFEVGDKGEFGIWLRDNDHWTDLVAWTTSTVVKSDTGANDLVVSAIGNQLSFSVNGVEVTTTTDDQLSSGAAGVFVGGDGNQVELDHVAVSQLTTMTASTISRGSE